MIRKKKNYSRPRKPFEKERINDENVLVQQYGLKNKKEIWRTLAKVNYYRGRAKSLATAPLEEQNVLFSKLQAIGLKVDSIADVLDLKVENLLERRLPTLVSNQKLASTAKQARQMVTHKRVFIEGKVVNSPSYIVKVDEEKKITVKSQKAPKPKTEVKEEVSSPQGEVKEAPTTETAEAPKEEAAPEAPKEKPKEEAKE
jgi:small subunit ribosomal protein S4